MNEPILAPPGLPPDSTVRAEVLVFQLAKLDELVSRTGHTRWEVLHAAIVSGLATMNELIPKGIHS